MFYVLISVSMYQQVNGAFIYSLMYLKLYALLLNVETFTVQQVIFCDGKCSSAELALVRCPELWYPDNNNNLVQLEAVRVTFVFLAKVLDWP